MVRVFIVGNKTVSKTAAMTLSPGERPAGGIRVLSSFVVIDPSGAGSATAKTVINNGEPTSDLPGSGSVALSNPTTIVVGDALTGRELIKIVVHGKLEYPLPT